MRKFVVEVRSWDAADKVICGVLVFATLYLLAHVAAAIVVRVW